MIAPPEYPLIVHFYTMTPEVSGLLHIKIDYYPSLSAIRNPQLVSISAFQSVICCP